MAQHKKHHKGSAHRTSVSQKRPRWLWVILGGLVLVGSVLLISLSTKNNQVSNFKPEATGGSRVSVSQEKFDYGEVKLGKTINTVFDVRNVGDQDLVIQGEPRIEVVEGCCPPRAVVGSSTVKPGQSTSISISFMMHAGMDGKHNFRVHLRTNDPVEPDKQLTILSNWVP